MKLLYTYLGAIGIILINLLTKCLFYINWNWNFTAILRLIAPILLFRYCDPIVAMMMVDGLLDTIEPNINRNNIEYHTRDKLLDLWGWTIGIICIWTINTNEVLNKYKIILTIFFVTRFIGTVLFIKTKKRELLAIFPNFYSTTFIALGFIHELKLEKYQTRIIIILLICKSITEYIHHTTRIRKKITPFRKYTKLLCMGKYHMYKNTGTYPNNPKSQMTKAPLFI